MKKNVIWGIFALAYGMSSYTFASDELDGEITLVGQVVEFTCLIDLDLGEMQKDCLNVVQPFASTREQSPRQGITTTRLSLANDTQRQIILNTYD